MTQFAFRPVVPGIAVLLCAIGTALQERAGQAAEPIVRRWLIAPAGVSAEIDANTSVADLEKRFGSENVQRAQVNLGEGETADGTGSPRFAAGFRTRSFDLSLGLKQTRPGDQTKLPFSATETSVRVCQRCNG
jgi:hypothetical protein